MEKDKIDKLLEYPPGAKCTACGVCVYEHADKLTPIGTTRCEKPVFPEADMGIGCWFWCVPCDMYHCFNIKSYKGASPQRPVWQFNGNMDSPTFTPSLLCRTEYGGGVYGPSKKHVCHLFVTNGQIQYLSDCTHAYAGRTVPVGHFEPVKGISCGTCGQKSMILVDFKCPTCNEKKDRKP